MTRDEFKVLIKGMKAVYAQPTFIPDQDAFNMWFALLGDLPYKLCNVAIQKYMLTNKFPPTVAEIRELTANISNGDPLTWGESWERALNAVRRFGSYNKQAALDSLDPLTRKCVDNIGYMQLCMSENIMVERAHYQKIFDIYAKREQSEKQMPLALQQAINQLQLKGMDSQVLLTEGATE
jgi:predicted nucleotidyltransferase